MVKPFCAVKTAMFLVITADSKRSPLAVVVKLPLFGDALLPSAVAGVPSRELLVATPEYSKMIKRSEALTDCDTWIVSGPPMMFSA